MIRSVAAIFARKTAIVAITGVVVIGGASLALAEEVVPDLLGDDPTTEVVSPGAADCTDAQVWNETTSTCDAALTADDCTGGLVLDEVTNTCVEDEAEEVCDPMQLPEGETCPEDEAEEACDPALLPEGETCPEDEAEEACDPALLPEGETCDADDDGDETDDVAGEHPENHGAYVSEAAKGGGECAGLTGRDKGQCVSRVARSDVGKKGAEAPAEEPAAAQPVVEQPVVEPAPVVEEPAATAAPTKAPKAERANAGPPAGKGNGGGGKGKKG